MQQQGVRVTKSNTGFLLLVGLYSSDDKTSQKELGDFLCSQVQDEISRLPGVGNVTVFGSPHAMRIWLNPTKLQSFNLSVLEVQNAIKSENIDVSIGQLGGLPALPGQQLNASIRMQSKFQTIEDFKNILIKSNANGAHITLQDIARIEMGSEDYSRIVRYKRHPAAGIAVSLAANANALDTAVVVKKKMTELSANLPENVKVIYPYDTTPFIKVSIENVLWTLGEAIFLVFCIIYLFLQNFRATLIPTLTIPIVLLGTCSVLYVCGFSINVLTLFAMVLAIGLLVDDAIVVIENVERLMTTEKLSPYEATSRSMRQITPALIGISLVLSAVFVPMGFLQGAAGAIYKQFSVTLIASMALSVFVALSVAPALCATLLKPKTHSKNIFFDFFNEKLKRNTDRYVSGSRSIINRRFGFIIIYLLLLSFLILMIVRLPTSFLPDEDQGIMYLLVQTPAGSSAERTLEKVKMIENDILNKEKESIDHLFTVVGFGLSGSAQNVAFGFLGLKDWNERQRSDQSVFALSKKMIGSLMQLKDTRAFAIFPPPIRELGNASGFTCELVDSKGWGHEALIEARNKVLRLSANYPELMGVRPNGLDDVPQFKLEINRLKAQAMDLSLNDIYQTMQTAWAGTYVNDFIDNNRIKKVYMQADPVYRMQPSDLKQWYIRNKTGNMVAVDTFTQGYWSYGSPQLERFNGLASLSIQGSAAPGVSTGSAMAIMEKIVQELPVGFGLKWTGLSYEERLAGSQAPALFILAVLFVFLCLAALYESWIVPLSVLFTIPLGIIGTVLVATMASLHNDIYFQVALLTTIGLVAKNAILIVQFAQSLYAQGYTAVDAALEAAHLRFRPILMTSMAFILGVLPLALSKGAGSASQNALGMSVIGGMIASTTIAIFFVPLFYVLMKNVFSKKS